jgi:ubiquitin carboxyl-terminal hydrolase L5
MPKDELDMHYNNIAYELDNLNGVIQNETSKKEKYIKENERRQHSYVPLIFNILKTLAEKGVLNEIVQNEKKLLEEKTTNKKNEGK